MRPEYVLLLIYQDHVGVEYFSGLISPAGLSHVLPERVDVDD